MNVTLKTAAVLLCCSALLSGCGGGGDDNAGSLTAFSIVPSEIEWSGGPGSCAAGVTSRVYVHGGAAPYRVQNALSGRTYQVQDGDTLRSIARQAYGDEGLWYHIAEGNGLSGEPDLQAGQTLTIPSSISLDRTQVDNRDEYFEITLLGGCFENAEVAVLDANGRRVVLTVTNTEGEED
jgi:LysM repeat protein